LVISTAETTDAGISFQTHMKVGKLFEDLFQVENQLEMHRKYKLSQINIRDAYRCIDQANHGYCTLEDYYNFFEEFYCEDLPVSTEEIDYLFKRHDREHLGRVSEAVFLKELMPLEDYIS
jgi:Ca2+-binding EF-hand superfamily protein